MDGRGLIVLAIGIVVAGAILSSPISEEEYTETYYTSEPYAYQQTLVYENQVRGGFLWLNEVTEVQYLVTNSEPADGEFTLNFIFDNGLDIETKATKESFLAGEQKEVTAKSSLNGKSSANLNVTPPNKPVLHQEIKTRKITGWEALWRLAPFVRK